MLNINNRQDLVTAIENGYEVRTRSFSFSYGPSSDGRRRGGCDSELLLHLVKGGQQHLIPKDLREEAVRLFEVYSLFREAEEGREKRSWYEDGYLLVQAADGRRKDAFKTECIFLHEVENPRKGGNFAISADGTVAEGEEIVQPFGDDVLVLSWSKGGGAHQHFFFVHKMPWGADFLTPQQEAAVQVIQERIAELWEGGSSMAKGILGNSMGLGWGLTPASHEIVATMDPDEGYLSEPVVAYEGCRSEYYDTVASKFSFAHYCEQKEAEKAEAEESARQAAYEKDVEESKNSPKASADSLASLLGAFGKK